MLLCLIVYSYIVITKYENNDQNYILKGSVDVQIDMFGDQYHVFIPTYVLSLLCSY